MSSSSLEESFNTDDTPIPSSKSGKGFEELYRLKGVVSFCFVLSDHRTMMSVKQYNWN